MAVGIFTILAGLVALAAAYFYFFGISPELKRKMEQQALRTMGENKMSYMAKSESSGTPCCRPRPIQTDMQLLTNPQVRSTKYPRPTKKTSRTSGRASAISPGVPCRIPLESKLVKPRIHSPVRLLAANTLVCTVRVATGLRDSAANLSKSVSDNVNWDTIQSYPKAALGRVSTMTGKSKETTQRTVEKKTE
ncbi:hypothetical protein BDW02DRAFT_570554 [Decorospora gaudefroyi]|uniref:Uncharacterized protein n=1 Tax=Decorospora gaudefroyi TaxID=184978 RepID=A0A6A5KCD0_9PLEO|nr:hypothetical protein BDW02DRAFT_570554 [Decorospora gaudefroyi]